jgi:hypothetical protein
MELLHGRVGGEVPLISSRYCRDKSWARLRQAKKAYRTLWFELHSS